MANALDGITKTGICDSCSNEKVLKPVPHHQANNPKLWWYCEVCKFAHDTEKGVQLLLRQVASRTPGAEEDPNVLAQLHDQVATGLLLEKAKNEALAPNEQIVSTQPVQEAEVIEPAPVEEPAPATEPTPETVPSEEAPVEETPTE